MYDAVAKKNERILLYIGLFLISIALFFASWWALHGNIDFHTDIARDFLLFEDIYYNKNITLLGPRSGGISGVFHGPLWLYVNIPAYVIGQGDPAIVGWFWVLLYAVTIFTVYWVARQLFGKKSAIIAAALFAISTASNVPSLFNPYGAVMLAPLFFYWAWLYIKKQQCIYLSLAILAIGFSIQFQMAFAMPMLVLITPLFLYIIFKHKKYIHLATFLLLIIPLSTFIVFELRHQFLQTKSVISYLTGGTNATKINVPMYVFFWKRIVAMTYEAVGLFTGYNTLVSFFLIGLFIYHYRNTQQNKKIFLLFIYLYLGFWLITLAYKGTIWGYYYWPFISIIAIFAGEMIASLRKELCIVVFAVVYLSNAVYDYKILAKSFTNDDTSLWQFYRNVAKDVYTKSPNEFGYYIYTTDQYGYSTRYAMNYIQRKYPNQKAYPFTKKPNTYLLIDDPGNHAYTNSKGWKQYDLKIQSKPKDIQHMSKTYWIEHYVLSKEEEQVPSNPNLIQDLLFR